MNTILRRSAVSAVALVLAASPVLAGEATPDLARGAKLYNDNCGRCHNPRSPSEYSDREWPLIVTHMRVIGGLPGDQARSIEAFLRATNNPPAPERTAVKESGGSEALDGQQLVERLGCRGCHVVGGAGGGIGPDLDTVFARRSEEYVREQIRHPKVHNPESVMPELGLSDAQIDAILSTLRAAH